MLQIEAEVVSITGIFSSSKIRVVYCRTLPAGTFPGSSQVPMYLNISGCGLRFTQWRLGAGCDIIRNHQNELVVHSIHLRVHE